VFLLYKHLNFIYLKKKMNFSNIRVDIEDGVCYIKINRPKQLNALNKETIIELNKAITQTQKNKSIRCLVITGEGKKAFVAGADIKEFIQYNKKEGEGLARKGQELLFDVLENASIPTIALINGYALGGGLELAMACHIRIASDDAMLGLPEVSLGLIPGYGGTQRLTHLVGKGKAIELITTAGMITAKEAKEIGLVNYVCNKEDLFSFSQKILHKIKRNSPIAISNAIKSINTYFIDGKNGFEMEKKLFGECFETKDFIEGTTAFIEKRKPKF
jgi:enoyl-CoA hydratase